MLGAGVMGLTAATLLLDLGLDGHDLFGSQARARPRHPRPAVNGPCRWSNSRARSRNSADIIKIAYTTFKASIGKGFGVSERPNYTASPSHNLDVVIAAGAGTHSAASRLSRLPFEGHTKPGFEYQTLLIEPPIFLAAARSGSEARGVTFVSKEICQQVRHLCLGAGEYRGQLHRARVDDAVERSQDGPDQGPVGDAAAAAGAAISLRPGRIHVPAQRSRRHRRDIRSRREQ